MAEGHAHSGQTSFDLQATDGNITSRGKAVAPTSLRWSGGDCRFDDIVAVELRCDTSEALIANWSVIRMDQSRLIIELTGKLRGEPAIYRNFVRSFVAELGRAHRARIAFRPVGHGNIGAIVWGALLVGSIVMMVWALAANQIAAAPENRLIIPTTGLLVPLFALALWKSLHRPAPEPLDPDNLEDSLPPTYYD